MTQTMYSRIYSLSCEAARQGDLEQWAICMVALDDDSAAEPGTELDLARSRLTRDAAIEDCMSLLLEVEGH